eukprot:403353709
MYSSIKALAFYKGMCPPLFTVPIINSIVFASYEFSKRLMGVHAGQDYTFKQSLISGMFAGFVNSFVLSPIELVKCRLQVQREDKAHAYYRGPLHCVKRIIKEEGSRGLYKGLLSTISRETPCYAGQFGGYFLTKKSLAWLQKKDVHDLGHASLFIAGGVGGFTCWLVSYPQDIIKTRLQVARSQEFANYNRYIRDGGMIECAKYIYKNEHGFMGFWRGFSACSARAVFANSFMFVAYEYAQKKARGIIE